MSASAAMFRTLAACAAALLCSLPAAAAPVTYTAWTVADVTLGKAHFKRARVHLTFTGDSADLSAYDTGPVADGNEGCGWQVQKGNASVRIVADGQVVTARFRPGQIAVANDACNQGVGFVSYFLKGGLQPGYPLVIDGGTVPYGSSAGIAQGQPGWQPTPNFLGTSNIWSGHAWSCIGFPPYQLWYDAYSVGASTDGLGLCGDPTAYPLSTDKGDFVIFQTLNYAPGEPASPPGGPVLPGTVLYDDYAGSMNSGFFSVAAE